MHYTVFLNVRTTHAGDEKNVQIGLLPIFSSLIKEKAKVPTTHRIPQQYSNNTRSKLGRNGRWEQEPNIAFPP
jgi:hypothetical protein